jgi:hypothetical protein
MSSWTIHLPPPDQSGVTHPERFVTVKDGLRPFAIVFGPFWFLLKRLWWGFLGVALIEAALFGLGWWLQWPRPIPALLSGAFHFLLGLEASSIQRWTLRRNGWREAGAVIAHGKREAEMRAALLIEGFPADTIAPPAHPIPAGRANPAPATSTPPVLGLFPEARPR